MENIKKGKIDIDRYRVKENEKVNLKKFPTKRDVDIDKGEVKNAFFPEVIEQLKLYQEKLYAQIHTGLLSYCRRWTRQGKTVRSIMFLRIWIPAAFPWRLLSSRQRKKKITIICGASIKHFRRGEISVFSIVPIMKMSL